MPRGRLKTKVGEELSYIGVLDPSGEIDASLDPDLPREQLLKLHRTMVLSRLFDEQQLKWQRQGRIGTFAPAMGQEAAQLGAVAALRQSDWMVPAFRETTASLWRGTPLEGLLLYNAGYNEGGRVPDGQYDLPIAIPVGSQLPHAVGLAYGTKYRRKEDVVMTFFGDGATSEGDFHEAMNYAAVFELPVVFVCQNNQWAISVPRDRQTASETLAQKSVAYDMPGVQVDGNDILAVYVAAREAVDVARSGGGPTMIECVTYRLSVHTTADDPTKYRSDEEVEEWKKRDPIPRFERYLKEKRYISDADIETLTQEVEQQIGAAWDTVERKMQELDDPLHIFEHIYAEPHPYLIAQRDALAEELTGREEPKDDG